MSTYYSFYIGYRTKDKKFHAFGPFDKDNKLRPILVKSRSFISDLYQEFYPVRIEDMDEFVEIMFTHSSIYGNTDGLVTDLKWLPVSDLPGTDFMKTGYFLTEEIMDYILTKEPCFSEHYEMIEYSILLEAAVKNNNTEEIERLKKYSFFSYPDYDSAEFESYILNHAISFQGPFSEYIIKESVKKSNQELSDIVILLDIN